MLRCDEAGGIRAEKPEIVKNKAKYGVPSVKTHNLGV